MKKLYVLAIGSFAVHGMASLKMLIAVLGEKILPVPSLILNGLTNMSLVKKFELPFLELLQSTFELAVTRDLDLIVYIGYLGKAEQANIILEMIDLYRDRIKTIITDPVCGDHGRTYVHDEVITRWPAIVGKSDLVFPNFTELKILSGYPPDSTEVLETYVERFQEIFPGTQLVATSITTDDEIGFNFYGEVSFGYSEKMLDRNYGGSGDAFVAFFILNRYYNNMEAANALKIAVRQTHRIIKHSIENDSDDLILDLRIINDEP